MRRKLLLVIGLLIVVFMFSGCGAEQKIIGEKAQGDDIYQVNVTNDTEKTITKVQIKDNSMVDYSDTMLPKEESFVAGETRTMYVNGEAAKAAEKQNPNIKESYQVKVTFDDKSEKTLTDVPFSDMKACIIKWDKDNEVAYLTYESEKDGKNVSTKEAEIKIKKDAEQKAAEQKAAEQKKAQESQAAAQANSTASGDAGNQQENTASTDNSGVTYSEPTGNDYSGGEAPQAASSGSASQAPNNGGSSGQAPASSDGCVNGGLMN